MSRIDDTLRELRSLDSFAALPNTLTRLDPRAKILATFFYIAVVVSFDRYTILALLPLAVYPVILAALGDVPPSLIARKLLIASPFALMIGIFNPLLDRAPLVDLFGMDIAAGWVSFASILLRFALTVSAALLLVATTGFHRVCAGLNQLGVPRILTTQLLFLFRYAEVLAGEASRMGTARELRACGRRRLNLGVYAGLLGHLLLRALERAQRIHLAMLARGFDGEMRGPHQLAWRRTDMFFLVLCAACFALARSIDLPRALGHILLGALP
ncbi:MAG: cobalt ECF transporter T component CbiQ [Betaproteobacteria bacterium]|nr:cobalt ECF transporter T component CbiQ [Betaproteobacteria bacterium]